MSEERLIVHFQQSCPSAATRREVGEKSEWQSGAKPTSDLAHAFVMPVGRLRFHHLSSSISGDLVGAHQGGRDTFYLRILCWLVYTRAERRHGSAINVSIATAMVLESVEADADAMTLQVEGVNCGPVYILHDPGGRRNFSSLRHLHTSHTKEYLQPILSQ